MNGRMVMAAGMVATVGVLAGGAVKPRAAQEPAWRKEYAAACAEARAAHKPLFVTFRCER